MLYDGDKGEYSHVQDELNTGQNREANIRSLWSKTLQLLRDSVLKLSITKTIQVTNTSKHDLNIGGSTS